MGLKDDINQTLKKYMIEKKPVEVATLRQIKTEIMKFETSGGDKKADDEQVQKILKSLAKQHQESIEIYQENGRDEAAAKEELELNLIKSFLPAEMDESTLEKVVDEAVTETGAASMKDMGGVMKKARELIAATGGAADGKLLSEMVKKKLS